MKQLSHFPSFPSHRPKKPINPIPRRVHPDGITKMHHFSFITSDATATPGARALSCVQISSLRRALPQLEGNHSILGNHQAPPKHEGELLLCCIRKYESQPFYSRGKRNNTKLWCTWRFPQKALKGTGILIIPVSDRL